MTDDKVRSAAIARPGYVAAGSKNPGSPLIPDLAIKYAFDRAEYDAAAQIYGHLKWGDTDQPDQATLQFSQVEGFIEEPLKPLDERLMLTQGSFCDFCLRPITEPLSWRLELDEAKVHQAVREGMMDEEQCKTWFWTDWNACSECFGLIGQSNCIKPFIVLLERMIYSSIRAEHHTTSDRYDGFIFLATLFRLLWSGKAVLSSRSDTSVLERAAELIAEEKFRLPGHTVLHYEEDWKDKL